MASSAHSQDAAPLTWRQVYILPTRYGGGLCLLLAAILLGAINYDNALAYLLCFLLGGLLLVTLIHTCHNLQGLALSGVTDKPAFAGTPANFVVHVSSDALRPRYSVTLARLSPARRAWWRRNHLDAVIEVPILKPLSAVALRVPTTRRGPLTLGRLHIESCFPLGLVRAWAYFDSSAHTIVYPRPAGTLPLPHHLAEGEEKGLGQTPGQDDFVNLDPYRPGDPLRAIHWPATARQDALVVKKFHSGSVEIQLRWSATHALSDSEARISQLTQWALSAERLGLCYSLELPTQSLPTGQGRTHCEKVLTLLAYYDSLV